MLSDTLWKAITFPITYLLLAVLVGTALMQIRYLNRALSRFDSTQVIPTQFVIFTISVILGSAVLYRDFESADAERFCKFIGGCALTFLGVYFLTSKRDGNDGTETENDTDTEQGIYVINEEETSENEVAEDRRFTTPNRSRRTSHQAPPRSGMLERMTSNISQRSQLNTPSSIGPDSPIGQNTWLDSPRDDTFRRHSNYASSSAVMDTLTNNTPVRPSPLTSPTGGHFRHRSSVTDFLPGLFPTALSSPLSGIIADRRRDIDTLRARRGLGSGRTKSSRLRGAESGGAGNGLQRNLPSAPVLTLETLAIRDPPEVPGTSDSSKAFLSRSLSTGDPTVTFTVSVQGLDDETVESTGAEASDHQQASRPSE